jgi:hypothetical protein
MTHLEPTAELSKEQLIAIVADLKLRLSKIDLENLAPKSIVQPETLTPLAQNFLKALESVNIFDAHLDEIEVSIANAIAEYCRIGLTPQDIVIHLLHRI